MRSVENKQFKILELVNEDKGFTFEMEGEARNAMYYVVCIDGIYRRTTKVDDNKIGDSSKRLLWVDSGVCLSNQFSFAQVKDNLELTKYTDDKGQVKFICLKKDIAKRKIAISQDDRRDILAARAQQEIELKKSSQPQILTLAANANSTFFSSNSGGVTSIPAASSTPVINSEKEKMPLTHEDLIAKHGLSQSIHNTNTSQHVPSIDLTKNTLCHQIIAPPNVTFYSVNNTNEVFNENQGTATTTLLDNKMDVQSLVNEGKGFYFEMESAKHRFIRYAIVSYQGNYHRFLQYYAGKLDDKDKRLFWVDSESGAFVSDQISLEDIKKYLNLTEVMNNNGEVKLVCFREDAHKRRIAISPKDKGHILAARSKKKLQEQEASQPYVINFPSNAPSFSSKENQGPSILAAPSPFMITSQKNDVPKTLPEINSFSSQPPLIYSTTNPFFQSAQETNLEEIELAKQTRLKLKRRKIGNE